MTILAALLAFLAAAMVSFTVVAAAVNNMSRIRGQQQEQRDYLAASSAAALLREELCGLTVTCRADVTLDGTDFYTDEKGSGHDAPYDFKVLDGNKMTITGTALGSVVLRAGEALPLQSLRAAAEPPSLPTLTLAMDGFSGDTEALGMDVSFGVLPAERSSGRTLSHLAFHVRPIAPGV